MCSRVNPTQTHKNTDTPYEPLSQQILRFAFGVISQQTPSGWVCHSSVVRQQLENHRYMHSRGAGLMYYKGLGQLVMTHTEGSRHSSLNGDCWGKMCLKEVLIFSSLKVHLQVSWNILGWFTQFTLHSTGIRIALIPQTTYLLHVWEAALKYNDSH